MESGETLICCRKNEERSVNRRMIRNSEDYAGNTSQCQSVEDLICHMEKFESYHFFKCLRFL